MEGNRLWVRGHHPDSPSPITYDPSPDSHRALRPTGRSIREGWVVIFWRDITLAVCGSHQDVRSRPACLEREDPAHPGEIGVDRWLQGGIGPGRTVVEADLHSIDAAIPGCGHPGCDRRPGRDLLALRRKVDATPDLVWGGITPTACLPVALVVIGDGFDVLDPLDVFHAVDRRHDQTRRETVIRRQRLAVHAGHQQRRWMHGLRQRDRIVIAVGGTKDDVDRLRVYPGFFQQLAQGETSPFGGPG